MRDFTPVAWANSVSVSRLTQSYQTMKAELVTAASNVVRNPQLLVNMVSRRVRQLTLGHRPLVEFAPGLGHADIALTEITKGNLSLSQTWGRRPT